ncbi:hypothetical protein, partial [Saccharothrix sp. ST-888]|uniref:hypothetical protein n=1 Tax=Saccharothrix sp. ST-888 TaxID=1427391 RepID=UPI0005EC82B8
GEGSRMVVADCANVIFADFTGAVGVIGHAHTRGGTEYTAGLDYHDQPDGRRPTACHPLIKASLVAT